MAVTNNVYFSEFKTFKKITNPKEREKTKQYVNNPYTLTGIDRLRVFYQIMGLEFDEEYYKKVLDNYSNFG